jgi:response regulator RpfG family c-di-GMP phosphodiesterase
MDVQMPVMDGLEATRRIRAMAPSLPVIGQTAHALAEERGECLAAGMVDVVTKPIDLALLIAAIRRQIAMRFVPPPAVLPASVESVESVEGFPSVASSEPAAIAAGGEIDWSALFARFNGRRDFIKRLTTSMRDHNVETPVKLRAAARQGDSTALAFMVHSLKGLSGNLSAHRLHELSTSVDATIRDCPEITAEMGLTIEKLALTLEAVLAELLDFHYEAEIR